MSALDLEQALEALSAALRRPGAAPAEPDLRRLYELAGDLMRARHGAGSEVNHCSIPGVSAAVLRMAGRIPPCRLLNVGMGGYPFVDLELARRGFEVTGLEYSHSLTALAREVARRRGGLLRPVVADGARLPFADGAFEACLCSETVEHVPDDGAVVREIHRVLRPRGTLLFTVPCLLGLVGLGRRAAGYLRTGHATVHPTHLREYTPRSARRLVAPWFSVERWEPVAFVTEPFWRMPRERLLGWLVRWPGLRAFAPSVALVLRRRR